jgi:methionyl-tRNA formyltransferase
MPTSKHEVAPLLRAYDPDVTLCWSYPWKLPQEALDVARLGSVNQHPALLPRHRGPIPFAWALREGDSHFGITWHRMDAELDTGPILAQTSIPIEDTDCTILDVAPRLAPAALGLLPRVFERLEAGDPGDPQPEEGASWAGHFDEDYAEVDWSQPARVVHNQVRAWNFTFGLSDLVAPVAELDGERVRLIRTSLTDPGDGARRVECGDGPIWIVEQESEDESTPESSSRTTTNPSR